MNKTWVLVADAGRAHIFASDPALGELAELVSLIHSPSRLRETEVYSDDRGSQPAPGGFGRLAAAEPKHDLHEIEAQSFAREVSGELERGLHAHAFDALVVVAPPAFLGVLRHALSADLGRRVAGTIAKDYAQLKVHELRPLLHKQLALRRAS